MTIKLSIATRYVSALSALDILGITPRGLKTAVAISLAFLVGSLLF